MPFGALVLEIVQGTDELELAILGESMCLFFIPLKFLSKLGSLLVWVNMSGLLRAQPLRVRLQILTDPLTMLGLNLNLNPSGHPSGSGYRSSTATGPVRFCKVRRRICKLLRILYYFIVDIHKVFLVLYPRCLFHKKIMNLFDRSIYSVP